MSLILLINFRKIIIAAIVSGNNVQEDMNQTHGMRRL